MIREAKVAEFHAALANNEPIFGSALERLKRIDLLYEEVDELEESLYHSTRDCHIDEEAHILKELCDVQYVLSGLILDLGYEKVFDVAFERVHLSNMAKVEGELTVDEWGKVMKPIGWKSPDLTDLVV